MRRAHWAARAPPEQGEGLHEGANGFGRPIADFRGLQFRVADMATELEVSQTFLWRAAAALDAADANATILSAMAKRYVTDAGFEIANQSLQLFGGYGYLADYGIEKSFAISACIRYWKAPTRLCA